MSNLFSLFSKLLPTEQMHIHAILGLHCTTRWLYASSTSEMIKTSISLCTYPSTESQGKTGERWSGMWWGEHATA